MDLENKVIVVTGAARGLGAAMAKRLATHRTKLGLIDLEESSLETTAAACKEAGAEVATYGADVSREDEVVAVFDHVVADLGSLHGLINNAGITRDALLVKFKEGELVSQMSLEQWQAVVDVNLTGTFLCGREAARHMIELGNEGVIINISSISRAGNMGQTNYSATKAGVQAMAVAWGKELARNGIRAAFIAPGFINTEMVAGMKQEARDKLTAGIPLKRIGEPDQVAQAAEFIFLNDYFSGRGIELDGALRM
jgi:3-oxoacyl-[acyl-carrier protein] reductase